MSCDQQYRSTMLDAANGSPDALSELVQVMIANDRELGLPVPIILERAEVVARLAAMHGRDNDSTVLATILLASADYVADPVLADRRRAEAVAHVEIQAAGRGPTAEQAATLLVSLADMLPASAFAGARAMLTTVNDAIEQKREEAAGS